jgi:hypothetical protein
MKLKYLRISILLIATVCLWGCQDSLTSNSQPQTAMALNGSHRMAEYIRNEPAVRNVRRWEDSHVDGLIIQTEHYTLYTTLLEPLMLRQMPAFLESAYKAYQSQLPQPIPAGQPLEVYLFDTRSQWEDFTRGMTGNDAAVYLQIQRGAYTLNGIVVAYNIGRKQTFSVVGHEGWHQFNQRLFTYRLPSWLDEGIATLFETCRYSQGRFVFEPSRNLMRLGALKETLLERQLLPLRELIILNPGQVLNGHGDDAAVIGFYAQNYALVRFLREYNYGLRLRKYHAMLLGGANGTWPLQNDFAAVAADRTRPLTVGWNMQVSPALFDYYLNEDMNLLETQYRDYCGKITYRIRLK